MRRRLLPKGLSRLPVHTLAAWTLGVLALAVTLTLDYRSASGGGPSYIFMTRRAAPKPAAPEPAETAAPVRPRPEVEAPPPERTEGAAPSAPKARPRPAPAPLGKVALVMDDMGNSLETLDELLGLGEPMTIAVLPYSARAEETARRAGEKGIEVLLHLPLESLNGNGGEFSEGLIRSGMGAEEIRAMVSGELDRIPFVRGVNNHMGSKVTADAGMMRMVLEPVRDRGLFFLDSRTTGRSVAYDVAVEMGVPAVSRQVFLDADGEPSLIPERLQELFRIAARDGRAVGICHPFPETLRALREGFRGLKARGLEAVPVSVLVR